MCAGAVARSGWAPEIDSTAQLRCPAGMRWSGPLKVLWLGLSLACGANGGTGETNADAATAATGVTDTADGGQVTGNGPADPGGDEGAGSVCEAVQHSGEATYYGADGSGNCSFDAGPDVMVAAMNDTDYANAGACGACVEVTGPDGTIVVRIVDRCPECPVGNIDLGEAAFPKIAAKELGRVPISWR